MLLSVQAKGYFFVCKIGLSDVHQMGARRTMDQALDEVLIESFLGLFLELENALNVNMLVNNVFFSVNYVIFVSRKPETIIRVLRLMCSDTSAGLRQSIRSRA